jgi:hypothetical protein
MEIPVNSPLDALTEVIQAQIRAMVIRAVKQRVHAGMAAMKEEVLQSVKTAVDYLAGGRWITDASCALYGSGAQTSHICMDLDSFFQKFKTAIIQAGQRNNIDARAIAGAIAWEYQENKWRGRFSDYLQATGAYRWLAEKYAWDSGIGWGSVHVDTASEFYPNADLARLDQIRLQAESAVRLIGEIMARQAELYFKESGGIFINDNPPVLALFYNTGDENLLRSARQRRLTHCIPVVHLDVSPNDMGSWVKENLEKLEPYRTPVCYPSRYAARSSF